MSTFERFSGPLPSWETTPVASPVKGSEPERLVATDPAPDQIEIRASVFDAIDRMEMGGRPEGFSEAAWFHLVRDLKAVTEQWLDIALGCGWDLLDLYGSAPMANTRVGLMGVAVLLHGRSIESIDQDRIVIANPTGAPNTYYRLQPGCTVPFDRREQVLIWDAIENERSQCC